MNASVVFMVKSIWWSKQQRNRQKPIVLTSKKATAACKTEKMLKDQLVALTLDLEDKTKVEELLRRKVNAVKAQLPRIEEDVKQRYQTILQVPSHDCCFP